MWGGGSAVEKCTALGPGTPVHKTVYGPLIGTGLYVMLLMQQIHYLGSTFLGPKRLDVISRGPKKSRFPGPNPLPLALVMDLPASKAFLKGSRNNRSIIANMDLTRLRFGLCLSVSTFFVRTLHWYLRPWPGYLNMFYEPLKKFSSLLCPSLKPFSKNTPTPHAHSPAALWRKSWTK